MSVMPVNPDDWVETTFRALKEYILSQVDTSIYDVINNFPSTDLLQERLPLDKTLIHFEIDHIENVPLGFGDNVTEYDYDTVAGTVIASEAQWHVLNIDIGVWASDRTGGVTARLRAYQLLCDMFNGVQAFHNFFAATDIEIQSFTGGQFNEELINEIKIWRVSNMTLVIRVFSRRKPTAIPYINEVLVVPDYVDVENTTINDS